MRRVIIESPYAGDIEDNVEYAKACIRDSLARGEAPFASHLFYTQVLNDSIAVERITGLRAGLSWAAVAEATVVYMDRGISSGMSWGIEDAIKAGRRIEYRTLARPSRHDSHA